MCDSSYYGDEYIRSTYGIKKKVCIATCGRKTCGRAHPNAVGSVVRNPKWCLRGSITMCNVATCPFNHFRTIAHFVKYREHNEYWAINNWLLVARYSNARRYYPDAEETSISDDESPQDVVYYNRYIPVSYLEFQRNKKIFSYDRP